MSRSLELLGPTACASSCPAPSLGNGAGDAWTRWVLCTASAPEVEIVRIAMMTRMPLAIGQLLDDPPRDSHDRHTHRSDRGVIGSFNSERAFGLCCVSASTTK